MPAIYSPVYTMFHTKYFPIKLALGLALVTFSKSATLYVIVYCTSFSQRQVSNRSDTCLLLLT